MPRMARTPRTSTSHGSHASLARILYSLLAIVEGCKHVASKPSKLNRKPILPEHLVALVNRFATPSASLGDIRDVCFCLLAFAGFLRFDELSRLRWSVRNLQRCTAPQNRCKIAVQLNYSCSAAF